MGIFDPVATTVNLASNTAPPEYAKPYYEQSLQEAQKIYNAGPQQYYPGQTYVDYSPQSQQALQGIEQRALTGSPLVSEAQNQAMATLRGDFLNAPNPYLQGVIQNAMQPIMASTNAAFSGSGRFGSGLFADTLANRMAQQATNMAFTDYNNERARQLGMIAQAPGLAAQDYADLAKLFGVGQAYEGKAGEQLADQVARFNFEQLAPTNALNTYLAQIRGGTAGAQQNSQQPYFSNPTASALGMLGSAVTTIGKTGGFGDSGWLYGSGGGGLLNDAFKWVKSW